MYNSPHKKSSIARQFIFYIVLFSSFLTLIITAAQLYRDYSLDIDLIHSELDQIENVHLGSLTEALWASNSKLLKTSINGILEIRDIQYVEIRDEKKIWAKAGEARGYNDIQRSYAMTYRHRNRDVNIGTLTVDVSLNGIYQRLYDKVWIILISNAVKTFLVAFFIYFLFHRLVARHLFAISEFSEKHDSLSNTDTLSLGRNSEKHDEFDAVVESINDMHARLQQQVSEINEQRQYLSLTLNSIGDAVITTDDKGLVTRLNPVAEQLTGWTNDEAQKLPLKTIFPIVDASTREPIVNPVEKVLTTGETVYLSNHTTLISKHGKEYQIADSAAPIRNGKKILGMVLVFNNVTEQYQMRKKLLSKEQEQREILQSMVEAVITIDENGMVSTFNHSAEILFGYAASEVLGGNINRLMPESFSRYHDDYIQNYLKTGEAKIIGKGREVIGNRKNNETFSMHLYVAELPAATDGKRRFIGSCTDLTKVKEHEEQLRRSQKMEALGKLTGGIAHDYNNMLGVVLGYSGLLKDGLGDQPELQTYAEQITRAGERGAKLTKKLLAFSRSKSSDTEKLNINTLLQEEQHMLEKTLTARIKLELKLENNLWPVCLGESELEDTILNISINAMHAIENNGVLTIETSNKKINADDGRQLSLVSGDYVQLSISDTGCGIDKTTREKIFDPFFSTKGEQGTGLGLTQVYGFINRSGGAIKVDSILEQGTQFTLYFPRYHGKDIEKNQLEVNKGNKELKAQGTLLVVDDEPALLNLTCKVLQQQGYQVLRAERAKQALEIMAAEKIDVLISDVIMPDMDGYELVSIVQKKYPDIKIQLVSGFSEGYDFDQVDENLIQNLLQKPYTEHGLLEKIRALLQ